MSTPLTLLVNVLILSWSPVDRGLGYEHWGTILYLYYVSIKLSDLNTHPVLYFDLSLYTLDDKDLSLP